MTKKQLQIHSENILPIIKKWLYSEKEICVRELISNACDAVLKRKVLFDHGDAESPQDPRIDVTIDKSEGTLTFSDNGVGMDQEEVEKYLSQIAFSGAEEFVKAYQANDPFIGHFGLGFYSAYMVADKVVVETLSCKKEQTPIRWSCDGSSSYEIEAGSRTEVGTDVILFIGKEHAEFLENAKIQAQLARFCSFLPYPIYFNGKRINEKDPLWIKQPHTVQPEEYINFFQSLYPFEEKPLFWIHLNIDYPFHVKGILYFPHVKRDMEIHKNRVALYSNRVFVSDDCKEILPEYLSIMKGVIDSPDIPLNVSRSYLQVDKTVRQLATHVSKKVIDALASLYKQDLEKFKTVWKDAEVIVKLGILQDESFYQKAKDILVFQTTKQEWMTLDTYRAKGSNTIFYTNEAVPHLHLIQLFEQKGLDVLVMKGPLDTALMAHLEHKMKDISFKRIDAANLSEIQDPEREKTLLDSEGKTEAIKIAHFMKQALSDTSVEVEAKSLASDTLPALISMPEEERRYRDYMKDIAQDSLNEGHHKRIFVVNTNSPLVHAVIQLKDKDEPLAHSMARYLFDLTKLSQKEMTTDELHAFIQRSHLFLQSLADQHT